MKKIIFSSLLIFLSLALVFSQNETQKLEKWKPTDLSFKTKINWAFSQTGPFEVDFYADAIGPQNRKLKIQGFYDGNDTWKIRFAPPAEGEWTITTHSDVLELDNKTIKLVCSVNSNPTVHGPLQIDAKNREHFIYEDGSRFFPVGYEANWLFAMDLETTDQTLATLNPFLDKLSSYGFNWINMNVWAYDTSWKNGKTEAEDLGPTAVIPWEGTNDAPNFKKFNLKYWQHFDKVVEALNQRGITTCLYLKVYNKLACLTPNNSVEDDLFFRWVIARYAAYPNIVWSLAKEAQYEKSTKYKVNRLHFIRENDPYQRLRTIHDDKLTYDLGYYNTLADFRSAQEFDDVQATVKKQKASNNWPLLMAEAGYEHGPKGLDDKTYSRTNTPEDLINNIWNIQMLGVYNVYYYTYTAWDIIRAKETPPGYTYVKNYADFFSKTNYWVLKPNDALLNFGRCLENPGEEYVVYQEQAKSFVFDIPKLPKSYTARWFQPLSGEYMEVKNLKTGKNDLVPPTKWNKMPVVLHIAKI